MAKLGTLTSNFWGTSLDSNWTPFTAGGATLGYSAAGVTVTYPASSTSSTDGDIATITTYDFSASYALLLVTAVPSNAATSTDAEMRVFTDANNWFRFVKEGSSLICQRRKAGTNGTIATLTYNATTHKWWKLTEASGVVTWWTSSDGLSWTSRGTYTHGMTITAMKVLIAGTCFASQSSPGTFQFSQFNVDPVTQTLLPPLIATVSDLFLFTLFYEVFLPFIASAAALYPFTITYGGTDFTLPFLASSSVLSPPAIAPGSVPLVLPFIASSAILSPPAIDPTSYLSLPQITSVAQLNVPTIVPQPVSIALPNIGSTQILYTPLVSTGPLMIGLPAIPTATQLYPFTAKRSIDPNELLLLGVG